MVIMEGWVSFHTWVDDPLINGKFTKFYASQLTLEAKLTYRSRKGWISFHPWEDDESLWGHPHITSYSSRFNVLCESLFF